MAHFKVPYKEEDFRLRHALLVIREWRGADTYPWMRRRVMDYLAPRLALLFTVIVLIVHATWAMTSDCGVNFQRAGSPIVLISAGLYAAIEWHTPKGGMLDGGLVEKLKLFNPLFLLPLLGVLGTAIWGYGDLFPLFGSGGCNKGF